MKSWLIICLLVSVIFINTNVSAEQKASAFPLIPKVVESYTVNSLEPVKRDLWLGAFKLIVGFKGDSEHGYIPPDIQIAVGPKYIVEMVNSRFSVFDKSGNLIMQKTLTQFFNSSSIIGDPRVVYDIESQRFFAVASDFNAGIVKIAVSKTSDPTGDWYIYSLNDEQGRCTDYPILGLSSDKVAITSNIFDNCSISIPSYLWVRLWILDKNQLINGYSSLSIYTTTYSNYFSIYPAKSLGGTSTLYMVSTYSGDVGFVVYFVVNGNPSSNNVQISIYYLSVRYIASPLPAPQKWTFASINTDDARVLDAVWYQNRVWFVTHEATLPANDNFMRDGIRVVAINTVNKTVESDITISIPQKYLFYPALSIDSNNNVYIVYGWSSENDYASINATVILNGQKNWLSPIQIKAGSFYETRNRYGDYFGASVDPADRTKVWVAGEYMDGINHWSTYIAQISVFYYVKMTLSYTVKSGSGYQPPVFSYYINGTLKQAILTETPTEFIVDKGSQWNVTKILIGSTQSVRWITNNQTSGIANESITIRFYYFQQFYVNLTLEVIGGGGISPKVAYSKFGILTNSTLPLQDWADFNSTLRYDNIVYSGDKERWITFDVQSLIVNSSISKTIRYYHQYYVTIKAEPQEGGSVNLNSGWYNASSTINLQAVANEGWKFMYWSGAYNGNSSSISITVNGSITQIAVFYLSVSINNTQGIIIEYKYDSHTGIINEKSNITLYLPKGSKLELKAKPTSFVYDFKGWEGSINSSNSTLILQLEKPIALRTESEQSNYFKLLVLLLLALMMMVLALIRYVIKNYSISM